MIVLLIGGFMHDGSIFRKSFINAGSFCRKSFQNDGSFYEKVSYMMVLFSEKKFQKSDVTLTVSKMMALIVSRYCFKAHLPKWFCIYEWLLRWNGLLYVT